jgi:formate dehydrogenase maturation protein FdhE
MDARVPPRYALRLEDLRAWHVVRVSCRVCRHKGEIAAVALSRGLPGYTRLIDLEGRLRCRNCGARGRASLVVDQRPRD